MSKMRGQITVIIFLAVLVLLSFGFVFILLSNSSPDFAKEPQDLAYFSVQWETQLQECTQQAIKSALITFGEQGGIIFHNQNTTINSNLVPLGIPTIDPMTNRRVNTTPTNQILVQIKNPTPIYRGGETYPCTSILPTSRNCQLDYRFDYSITSAFSSLAPKFNICDADYPEGCVTPNCFCKCSGPACEQSILKQLKVYVHNYTSACFNPVKDDTIVSGPDYILETDVSFNRQSITASSIAPITVNFGESDQTVTSSASIEIFLELLDFVNQLEILIKNTNPNERGYPQFDLGKEMADEIQGLWYERTIEDSQQINILKLSLNETQGNVLGRPFVYNYVRENRPPLFAKIELPQQSVSNILQEIWVTYCPQDPDDELIRDRSNHINWNIPPDESWLVDENGDIMGRYIETRNTTIGSGTSCVADKFLSVAGTFDDCTSSGDEFTKIIELNAVDEFGESATKNLELFVECP